MRRFELMMWAILVASICGFPAIAQETSRPRVVHYIPPKIISPCGARAFGANDLRQEREGWVNLRFTVKKDGTVVDPEVISAFGGKNYGAAALEWLANCKVEPAKQDGVAIDQVDFVRSFFFSIDDIEKGGSPRVRTQMREFGELIDAKQFDAASAALDKAEKDCRTLYEIAHLMWSRAVLQARRGNHETARLYLNQTGHLKTYMEPSDQSRLDRMKLRMEMLSLHVVAAEFTADHIPDLGQREGDDELKEVLAKLKAASVDEPIWDVEGQIPRDCPEYVCGRVPTWEYKPLHRTISLDGIAGNLSLVEIVCQSKKAKMEPKPNVTWTIPASWQSCSIRVTGEPGARFTLVDEKAPS